MIHIGGDDEIGPGDDAVVIQGVFVIESPPRHLCRSHACPELVLSEVEGRSRRAGPAPDLDATVLLFDAHSQQLVDDAHTVLEAMSHFHQLGDVVHERIIAHRLQTHFFSHPAGQRGELFVVVVEASQSADHEGFAGRFGMLGRGIGDDELCYLFPVLRYRGGAAIGRSDDSVVESVLFVPLEGQVLGLPLEIRDLQGFKDCYPGLQVGDGFRQPLAQSPQFVRGGEASPAVDHHVDRMRGAATQQVAPFIAQAVQTDGLQ